MNRSDRTVTTFGHVVESLNNLRRHFVKLSRYLKVGLSTYTQRSNGINPIVTKKLKMALLVISVTIVFILVRLHVPVSYDDILTWGGLYFVISVLSWLGTIQILRPVNKYTIFSVLMFPAIFVFMGTMVIHLIFLFDLARISYILVFAVLVLWFILSLWIFMLMTNILNVNMQTPVPISRLAEGVLRLYVVSVHVLLGFVAYILVTGQYLLFSFNSLWLILGIILLIFVWRDVYQYFSRDFSMSGTLFAIGVVVSIILVSLILFAIVPNTIVILIILLYLILRFFEYFVEDMHNVD